VYIHTTSIGYVRSYVCAHQWKLTSRLAISFKLFFHYVPNPDLQLPEDAIITSEDQLVRHVLYTPHELDKLPENIRDDLGFLGEPFRFAPEQTSVFLRTVYDRLAEMMEGQGSSDGEDEEDGAEESMDA
jgi:hypothetical protein